MRSVSYYLVFTLLLEVVLIMFPSFGIAEPAENPAELKVVQGNNQLTSDLYNTLTQKPGNVIFSPISVHAVLSMAFQGAQGTTAELFASTLKVPEAKAAAEGYNAVMNRLNSISNVTLLMANKIYMQKGAELLTDFEKAVRENFLSEVQPVDFAESAIAAKTINDWVTEKTQEKIKDLIQEGDLNELTRLVLVNAIYFKGSWKHKFSVEKTKIEPFYLNDVDTVDVHMMHIKKKFSYKEDQNLDAQILELPYTNENISMIIILPKKKNGISDLEKKLIGTNLSEVTNELWATEVNVALPRFKIEQTIDLKNSLSTLGLGEIFDEHRANFKGMIKLQSHENLFVSKIVQKAFIEVNEEGAEAAAATGMIMMMRCSLPLPPREFIADHPFIYILAEKRSNPLFAGRISNPV